MLACIVAISVGTGSVATGCANMTRAQQRALSGGAMGAAGGALLGGGKGAAIGGAAGATGGYIYEKTRDRDR
ncbi:MAG: hypothetical protein DCC71_05690 [Proteobacteria bacterium]|nr:MAG: hypothetical protein DCC71_05690 [Pseudomonadota bacterium]